MKKLLILFSLFFFLGSTGNVFASVLSPSPVASSVPSPKTSYELFYPIVAGVVPGDGSYFFKSIREWFVGNLIFDNIKAADYHLALSKKRLVESEKLIQEKKSTSLIKDTLQRSLAEYQNALTKANKAKAEGKPAEEILTTIKNDGNNISDFLQNLSLSSGIGSELGLSSLSEKFKSLANSI